MKRNVVLCAILVLILIISSHAAISFTVKAARTTVAVGEHIELVATLESPNQFQSVPTPRLTHTEGIENLGTSRLQSSSTNIEFINGRQVQKTRYSYAFTYSLRATQTGRFDIPPLELKIGDRTFTTNRITLTVTDQKVRNPDIRVSLGVNKRTLYTGEQAVLTFKVAQRSGSSIHQIQRGFHSAIRDLETMLEENFSISRLFTNQISNETERVGGELYNTYFLRYSLFPLQPGNFSFSPIAFEFDEVRQSPRRQQDPFFRDFFGSGFFGDQQLIKQTTYSNALAIEVKPLPPTPRNFSRSVGNFDLRISSNQKEIPAGEGLTIRLTLSGNTRPSGMGEPVMPQIRDADIFTPQRQVRTDTTASGLSTRITYSYLVIPRHEGDLVIEPVTYTFFNPRKDEYTTIQTEPVAVAVTPGTNERVAQTRHLTQEEIRQVGDDIRYIQREGKITAIDPKPHRSLLWYLLFTLPLLLVAVSAWYRYYINKSRKHAGTIIKQKAHKKAFRAFGKLKSSKTKLTVPQFLKQVSLIVENYISQKFGFPPTGRTLEELKEELMMREVDYDTVENLTTFMEQIDEFRFGGKVLQESSRNELIGLGIDFLRNVDQTIKPGKPKTANALLTLLAVSLFYSVSYSSERSSVDDWFNMANNLYDAEQYDSAKTYYQKIIESGINNDMVFYNLGNVYYRLNKPGLARLHYEKAALLNPSNTDVTANINFINKAIIDKLPQYETTALDLFLQTVVSPTPLRNKLLTSFFLLLIISIMVSLSLFVPRKIRTALITVAVILSLPLLFISFSTGVTVYRLETAKDAIVTAKSIDAKNQPHGSNVLFTVHEGTKVSIRRSMEEWSLISLPHGVSGWVENQDITPIAF